MWREFGWEREGGVKYFRLVICLIGENEERTMRGVKVLFETFVLEASAISSTIMW